MKRQFSKLFNPTRNYIHFLIDNAILRSYFFNLIKTKLI